MDTLSHFLTRLALKKSFRPDIIFIDYLNICASSRYRGNLSVNSYSYIKAIAEEAYEGCAVETNVPIVSATQTTRSGYGSDVGLLILVSPLVSLLLLILCLPLLH